LSSRETLVILTVALLISAAVPRTLASSQNTFPPYSRTEAYAIHLIDNYNNISEYNGAPSPDVQRFYGLYHAPGDTFKVIVLPVGPADNKSLNLLFAPIPGNEPTFIFDSSHYLFDMRSPATTPPTGNGGATYPGNCAENGAGVNVCVTLRVTVNVFTNVNLTADHSTADDLLLNYNGSITYVSKAIGVNASDITGNYTATSEAYANWLYYQDVNEAQSWLAANTPTITLTTTTSTTSAISGVQGQEWYNSPIIQTLGAIVIVFGFFEVLFKLWKHVNLVGQFWFRLTKRKPKQSSRSKAKKETEEPEGPKLQFETHTYPVTVPDFPIDVSWIVNGFAGKELTSVKLLAYRVRVRNKQKTPPNAAALNCVAWLDIDGVEEHFQICWVGGLAATDINVGDQRDLDFCAFALGYGTLLAPTETGYNSRPRRLGDARAVVKGSLRVTSNNARVIQRRFSIKFGSVVKGELVIKLD
jgi:hypothetical protein